MVTIKPDIDELMAQVDSRFTLAVASAKRAREINQYFNSLRGLVKCDYMPPRVDIRSKKSLTIAFEEIRQKKIKIKRKV